MNYNEQMTYFLISNIVIKSKKNRHELMKEGCSISLHIKMQFVVKTVYVRVTS